MNNFLREIWNKTACKKQGVCTINPVINAINAVIINEVRQIAFYVVKLKEFNLINSKIMKDAVLALSVTITDTDFDKNALLDFYKKINGLKNEVRDFYVKKAAELNISYEFIPSLTKEDLSNCNCSNLIKTGEEIIKHLYSVLSPEKSRLIAFITNICKTTAIVLSRISNYGEPDSEYYFEVLRLLGLTNNIGTRQEKFIRRIKEFSEINLKIREELNIIQNEMYGKPENGIADVNFYAGKSVLVTGCDLYELYNLLEKTKEEEINIYIGSYLINALFFPKFREYKNFKGLFGTGENDYDFSNFKGAVYITENSAIGLDSAFRGSIFTTKLIPSKMVKKISKNNLAPLIEEAKRLEGFDHTTDKENIVFNYQISKDDFEGEEKFLIVLGIPNTDIENNFKGYKIINLVCPNETYLFYRALDFCKKENTSVYFSDCSNETIGIISSILNKGISEIYFSPCPTANINPHIVEALKNDFSVKTV